MLAHPACARLAAAAPHPPAMSAFAWATLADALAPPPQPRPRCAARRVGRLDARKDTVDDAVRLGRGTGRTHHIEGCRRRQGLCLSQDPAARSTSGARSAALPALSAARAWVTSCWTARWRRQLGLVLGQRCLGSVHGVELGGRLGDGGLGRLDLLHCRRRAGPLARAVVAAAGTPWRRPAWCPPRPGCPLRPRCSRPRTCRSALTTVLAGPMRATWASTAAVVWGSTWSTFLSRSRRLDARHLVVDHALRPGAAVDDLLEHRVR